MRIISGQYKGHRFSVRKNFPSRPTTDFAKENLFNVIGNYFDLSDVTALDLFAGTGSISFEFASRGASVNLIERNSRSIAFIKKNIATLKIENIHVIAGDVFRLLKKIEPAYDIVFADPPYELKNIDELPGLVFQQTLLKESGWFILEHSNKYTFNAHPYFKELRKYGSVHFSIFEYDNS